MLEHKTNISRDKFRSLLIHYVYYSDENLICTKEGSLETYKSTLTQRNDHTYKNRVDTLIDDYNMFSDLLTKDRLGFMDQRFFHSYTSALRDWRFGSEMMDNIRSKIDYIKDELYDRQYSVERDPINHNYVVRKNHPTIPNETTFPEYCAIYALILQGRILWELDSKGGVNTVHFDNISFGSVPLMSSYLKEQGFFVCKPDSASKYINATIGNSYGDDNNLFHGHKRFENTKRYCRHNNLHILDKFIITNSNSPLT